MVKLEILRKDYHRNICSSILGIKKGIPNIADSSSKSSTILAEGIIENLKYKLCSKPPKGQTCGARFAEHTMDYLNKAFDQLGHIRPGNWFFSAGQGRQGIAAFDQYNHLAYLKKLQENNKELASIVGSDYLITPDIIVARMPLKEKEINAGALLTDRKSGIARYTPLRQINYDKSNSILHASISCKWTIRSDRTQNTRTEALNLIRNRKGNTPHIVAVIAEPLPTRIAAIAMGTGDIDCVYHMALYELMKAAKKSGLADQLEMLESLIEGRRLRDISDLVFDLAI